MAIATKKLLADGLKELLEKKTLDKITVKELVATCGVNRQTFYYNFQDIYELLEWIFVEEGKRVRKETAEKLKEIYDNVEYDELSRVLMIKNHEIKNIGKGTIAMQIDRFMQSYFRPAVEEILTEYIQDVDISEENREFMIRMYDLFWVDLLMRWIQTGMEISEMTGDIEKIMYVMTGSSQYIAQSLKAFENKDRKALRLAGEKNKTEIS